MGFDNPNSSLVVISASEAFCSHLDNVLTNFDYRVFRSCAEYLRASRPDDLIVIVHQSADHSVLPEDLKTLTDTNGNLALAVASDQPTVDDLLGMGTLGAKAYCNSYMAQVHYRHLIGTLAAGETWYAPQLLPQVLALARQGVQGRPENTPATLEGLTAREEQIARAVAEGNSNKVIARTFSITERTVKAHLSSIYQKLGLRDRMELARRLLTS